MKKIGLLIVLASFLLLSSNVMAQHIQSGEYQVNSQVQGYTLNKGTGERVMTIEFRFQKPFETTPEVLTSISYINADTKAKDLKIKVEPSAVSRDGFILKIGTWDDSIVYGIRGQWMAYSN